MISVLLLRNFSTHSFRIREKSSLEDITCCPWIFIPPVHLKKISCHASVSPSIQIAMDVFTLQINVWGIFYQKNQDLCHGFKKSLLMFYFCPQNYLGIGSWNHPTCNGQDNREWTSSANWLVANLLPANTGRCGKTAQITGKAKKHGPWRTLCSLTDWHEQL